MLTSMRRPRSNLGALRILTPRTEPVLQGGKMPHVAFLHLFADARGVNLPTSSLQVAALRLLHHHLPHLSPDLNAASEGRGGGGSLEPGRARGGTRLLD